jgi:hypothetical protein
MNHVFLPSDLRMGNAQARQRLKFRDFEFLAKFVVI